MKTTISFQTDVDVYYDPEKFTPKFMESFRGVFYDFDSVEEHLSHIASCAARGLVGGVNGDFLEGYGNLKDFGIRVRCHEFEPSN